MRKRPGNLREPRPKLILPNYTLVGYGSCLSALGASSVPMNPLQPKPTFARVALVKPPDESGWESVKIRNFALIA